MMDTSQILRALYVLRSELNALRISGFGDAYAKAKALLTEFDKIFTMRYLTQKLDENVMEFFHQNCMPWLQRAAAFIQGLDAKEVFGLYQDGKVASKDAKNLNYVLEEVVKGTDKIARVYAANAQRIPNIARQEKATIKPLTQKIAAEASSKMKSLTAFAQTIFETAPKPIPSTKEDYQHPDLVADYFAGKEKRRPVGALGNHFRSELLEELIAIREALWGL